MKATVPDSGRQETLEPPEGRAPRRSSKQKILQLKEEINAGKFDVDLSDKFQMLKDSYELSKTRAEELFSSEDLSLYLKIHGQRAGRIYSALSTLLYATISIAKVDELEGYIKKASAQIPSTIFDYEEWGPVLKMARDYRDGELGQPNSKEQLSIKKKMSICHFLATNPIQNTKAEIGALRTEVIGELNKMYTEFVEARNLMFFTASKLQEKEALIRERENAVRRAEHEHQENSEQEMGEVVSASYDTVDSTAAVRYTLDEGDTATLGNPTMEEAVHTPSEALPEAPSQEEFDALVEQTEVLEKQLADLVQSKADIEETLEAKIGELMASNQLKDEQISTMKASNELKDKQLSAMKAAHTAEISSMTVAMTLNHSAAVVEKTTVHADILADVNRRLLTAESALAAVVDQKDKISMESQIRSDENSMLSKERDLLAALRLELEEKIALEMKKTSDLSGKYEKDSSELSATISKLEKELEEIALQKKKVEEEKDVLATLKAELEGKVSVELEKSSHLADKFGKESAELATKISELEKDLAVEQQKRAALAGELENREKMQLEMSETMSGKVRTLEQQLSEHEDKCAKIEQNLLEKEAEKADLEAKKIAELSSRLSELEKELEEQQNKYANLEEKSKKKDQALSRMNVSVVDAVDSVVAASAKNHPNGSFMVPMSTLASLSFESGTLLISKIKVKNLRRVELLGRQDPYLVIQMGSFREKIPTAQNAPADEVVFDNLDIQIVVTGSILEQCNLEVEAFEENSVLADGYIGHAKLSATELMQNLDHACELKATLLAHETVDGEDSIAVAGEVTITARLTSTSTIQLQQHIAELFDLSKRLSAENESLRSQIESDGDRVSKIFELQRELGVLKESLAAASAAVEAKTNAISEMQKEKETISGEIDVLKLQVLEMGKAVEEVEALKQQLEETTKQKELLSGEIEALTIKLEERANQKDSLSKEIDVLKMQLEELSELQQEKELQKEQLHDRLETSSLDEGKIADEIESKTKRVDELTEQRDQVPDESMEKKQALTVEIDELTGQVQELQAQKEGLGKEVEDLRKQLADLAAEHQDGGDEVSEKREALDKQVESSSVQQEQLSGEIDELKMRIAELSSDKTRVDAEVEELRTKLEEMSKLQEEKDHIAEEMDRMKKELEEASLLASFAPSSSVSLGAGDMQDPGVLSAVAGEAPENPDEIVTETKSGDGAGDNDVEVNNDPETSAAVASSGDAEPSADVEGKPTTEEDNRTVALEAEISALKERLDDVMKSSAEQSAVVAEKDLKLASQEATLVSATTAAVASAAEIAEAKGRIAQLEEEVSQLREEVESALAKAESAQQSVIALENQKPTVRVPDQEAKSSADVSAVEGKDDEKPVKEETAVELSASTKVAVGMPPSGIDVVTIAANDVADVINTVTQRSPRSAESYEAQAAALDVVKDAIKIMNEEDREGQVDEEGNDPETEFPSSASADATAEAAGTKEAVTKTESETESTKNRKKKIETPEEAAVAMQTLGRSYLAKKRVNLKRTEIAAAQQGVLVAYRGTKQGESGWYIAENMLFYFTLDKGEYVLLCGPISVEMYELALQEIQLNPAFHKTVKFPLNLSLDRLGLHATRVQIETLLDDVRDRDMQLDEIKLSFQNFQGKLEADIELRERQVNNEFARLEKDNALGKDVIAQLRKELGELKKHKVKEAIEQKLNAAAGRAAIKAAEGAGVEAGDEPTGGDIAALLSTDPGFAKLSAVTRGFLSRRRVLRLRLFKVAKETGVLVAMRNTQQGQTGWYIGPNGKIYYFVLLNGEWLHAAGPISESEFNDLRLNARLDMNSLSRCSGLKLTDNREDVLMNHGDLYLSQKTCKLFLALPVELLVSSPTQPSALYQQSSASIGGGGSIGSGGGGSLLSTGKPKLGGSLLEGGGASRQSSPERSKRPEPSEGAALTASGAASEAAEGAAPVEERKDQ